MKQLIIFAMAFVALCSCSKGDDIPKVTVPPINTTELPLSNEIWYLNGNSTKPTKPYRSEAFGVNIISNEYSIVHNCWVIKFDGDLTTIDYGAFADCNDLLSVTFPNSVVSIGESAFHRCKSLQRVHIPTSVTKIDARAFFSCENLLDITIPDGVTTIGDRAFYRCTSFVNLVLPGSVTTLEQSAFYGCSGIRKLEMSEGVETIDNHAFANCDKLEYVILPPSLTSLGSDAFYQCSKLEWVFCKPLTPPVLKGSGQFYLANRNLKICIQETDDDSVLNAYKNSWSEFADHIIEYPIYK